MPKPPVGYVWVNHESSDPGDLVNRNAERKELFDLLTALLGAGSRGARILVTGDRGVGKSILTRAVIEDFVRANQDRVVSVRVNGRGVGYRAFLQTFARDLALVLRPYARRWSKPDIDRWLDELVALTNTNLISRAQAESFARKYGAGADVGGDALIYKIAAKFNWEETHSLGVTTQSTLHVTDELLHDAIAETLERLRGSQPPITIVVFYDDLDQAFSTGTGADVESAMQRVLELQPCLAVAHIRTEALFANVRRIVTDEILVPPLPPGELLAVLRQRVATARVLWATIGGLWASWGKRRPPTAERSTYRRARTRHRWTAGSFRSSSPGCFVTMAAGQRPRPCFAIFSADWRKMTSTRSSASTLCESWRGASARTAAPSKPRPPPARRAG
jgi:hypothetical protein